MIFPPIIRLFLPPRSVYALKCGQCLFCTDSHFQKSILQVFSSCCLDFLRMFRRFRLFQDRCCPCCLFNDFRHLFLCLSRCPQS
ncbi:hypothetical protein 2019_scaffold132_00001 [Bacteriophage sp.]|nr:hypothetical protein 2019_scaffold132_00001 [Bacteriophage sp.]